MADTLHYKASHDVEKSQTSDRDLDRVTTVQVGQQHSHDIKKDFGPFTIIALGFNICNSWVAIATSFAIVVAAGGTVTLVYGVIIASLVYATVAASLAELASVYPTAGGQYHFTALVAPKAITRVASYACGVISIFSWIALCAAATILGSQILLALPVYYDDTYVPKNWHYFLVYQAINVTLLIYNMFALKRTLWVHDAGCKFCSLQFRFNPEYF